MSKRYHYNRRGRYTGYSSGKGPNSSLGGIILGLFIICFFLKGC